VTSSDTHEWRREPYFASLRGGDANASTFGVVAGFPDTIDPMNATFLIRSDSPRVLSAGATQVDPAELSCDELRICFPGRVAMVVNGEECVVLDNAPIIGVVVEVSESLLSLKQGAPLAEVVDFYGEYKLAFHAKDEVIECEDEFAGTKCEARAVVFRAAARRWCDETLAGIEERYPTIAINSHYQRLKAQVARTWRDEEAAD
jgi:hypothetical protein